jgi:hypothetical protein
VPRYRAPPRDRWPERVARNRQILQALPFWLGELRAAVRGSAPAAVIATGHQPELFHPGVWAKNFAAGQLADRLGGTATNYLVDTDTLGTHALAVPLLDRAAGSATLLDVPFDAPGPELAFRERTVRDRDLFASFADRLHDIAQHWPFEPLAAAAWRDVLAAPHETLGGKFAHARQCRERAWGLTLRDVAVSELAQHPAFTEFARRLLHDLPRFAESYNRAVGDYRRAHKLKSKTHPVPLLTVDEAPFWGPSRSRATRQSRPETLVPRALTLTLFLRLCACDFFFHGVGGGKYDEVTDAIIADYFGLEPPAFAVLTRTERLPFPPFAGPASETLARQLRDLAWNPHRTAGPADWPATLPAKPAGRAARRAWFAELRRRKRELRSALVQHEHETRRQFAAAERRAAANAALFRRDFAWILFPEAPLRAALSHQYPPPSSAA